MGADDLVERGLGLKAEGARAGRVQTLRPTRYDALNQRIRLATDAGCRGIAGNALERGDLFAYRAGHTGHGEIDAGSKLIAQKSCRAQQKADRRAWARMRVPHALGDRQ